SRALVVMSDPPPMLIKKVERDIPFAFRNFRLSLCRPGFIVPKNLPGRELLMVYREPQQMTVPGGAFHGRVTNNKLACAIIAGEAELARCVNQYPVDID